MAKKPAEAQAQVQVKVIQIPVVISQSMQDFPREKIDIVPIYVDFKIAQLSDTELIDQLGHVKAAGKELEKWEKLAVNVVKARLPEPGEDNPCVEFAGNKFKAIRTMPNRHAISLEKLKAKFGEAALEDCYGDTPVDTLNIKPC